ncbi:MAG: DUF1289 domain-containing protein [Rubripirellula sp.]
MPPQPRSSDPTDHAASSQSIQRVSSPCNGICTLNSRLGICVGCHRTQGEIANWSQASDLERQSIVSACEARAQR